MPSHTVKIGGEDRTLQEFSGFKAFKAMRLLKEILAAGPQIETAVAEHRRKYNVEQAIELDRASALFRYGAELAHLTDADWKAAGDKIRIPQDPSPLESGMAAFPVALDVAERQTLLLLALVLAANRELEEWDDAGTVDTELEGRAKRLPHQALAHELLAIAGETVELLDDQFSDTVAALEESDSWGKLARLVVGSTPTPTTPADEPEEEPAAAGSPTSPEEPTSPSPDSSTSSPDATDGPSTPSSIAPVGAASPSSAI